MVRLLAVPLQEECWPGLIALLFLKGTMIRALEIHLAEFSYYVLVIPPSVRLIPPHIAIKIAENDCLWLTQIFTMNLKVFPELPHVAKCFVIPPLRPDCQHSDISVDSEREKKPKIAPNTVRPQ